ncbi:MAG: helix-turn-helix domain-containing protein [Natronomonas sp.]
MRGVRIRHLGQSVADSRPDTVAIDRGRLTDRQREVLRTAYDMGYFSYPRGANATEIADILDIATSTFLEHVSSAQAKLLGGFFEDTIAYTADRKAFDQ